ncbi:response regulator transcription factor [bacterium]|nr:response regulator transcription factor [bacterium]QQR58929.1 MAG: response regulator transcription factor [Candidatus Melainabacteria bacterium]
MSNDAEQSEIKIFIVDDHEIVRTGLKLLLAQWSNLSVVGEASSGKEVLDLAEVTSADMVLMDVAMPVMDGVEATHRLLTKHRNIKVIMLTSKGDEGTILASLSSGASGYCLKDVKPQRLYNGMQCVLKGDLWLDSEVASVIIRSFPKNANRMSETPATSIFQPPLDNLALPKPKEIVPAPVKGNLRLQSAEFLSTRELEVLALIVDGLSNQAIADKLVISIDTVKTHIRHIMEKMSVSDRTQAAIKAIRNNLVE